MGTGLLSLYCHEESCLLSGPCSEEETELTAPGQAAVAWPLVDGVSDDHLGSMPVGQPGPGVISFLLASAFQGLVLACGFG